MECIECNHVDIACDGEGVCEMSCMKKGVFLGMEKKHLPHHEICGFFSPQI